VELLKRNPGEFVNSITDFLHIAPLEVISREAVNVSTRIGVIIQLWRPVNYLFNVYLKLLGILRVGTDEKMPYAKQRYSYYAFKRRVTRHLNKGFRGFGELDLSSWLEYDDLFHRFAASNQRLQTLLNINLEAFNYPMR
jgi:hypothetical protein